MQAMQIREEVPLNTLFIWKFKDGLFGGRQRWTRKEPAAEFSGLWCCVWLCQQVKYRD